MMSAPKCFQLFDLMIETGMCRSVEASRYYLNYAFSGLPLADKSVLDIGCGPGITAAYALCQGAKMVVGLEPELKGSQAGSFDRASEIISILDIDGDHIQLLPQTIQDYDSHGVRFDLVLIHNSINHLDEAACQKLHVCPISRETYTGIFSKVYDLMNDDSALVIMDCSRYNLWPLLGLRNPFSPRIQWVKHQPPELWIDLASRCGLKAPTIQWACPTTLWRIGRLLRNRFIAFLFTSHFRLVMQK